MKILLNYTICALSALGLALISLQAAAGNSMSPVDGMTMTSANGMEDTLVIVDKIIGVDAEGTQHTLYDEENGRVYRLHNIDQAIHDLNARGIESKGTFRSLRAVLNDTVYVFAESSNPSPVQRTKTSIPESLALSVERVRVTKDRVIAIYTTNCDSSSI